MYICEWTNISEQWHDIAESGPGGLDLVLVRALDCLRSAGNHRRWNRVIREYAEKPRMESWIKYI